MLKPISFAEVPLGDYFCLSWVGQVRFRKLTLSYRGRKSHNATNEYGDKILVREERVVYVQNETIENEIPKTNGEAKTIANPSKKENVTYNAN
jgi:hypothetical protein